MLEQQVMGLKTVIDSVAVEFTVWLIAMPSPAGPGRRALSRMRWNSLAELAITFGSGPLLMALTIPSLTLTSVSVESTVYEYELLVVAPGAVPMLMVTTSPAVGEPSTESASTALLEP